MRHRLLRPTRKQIIEDAIVELIVFIVLSAILQFIFGAPSWAAVGFAAILTRMKTHGE